VNVRFLCPACETPANAQTPAPAWRCPNCDHLVALADPPRSTGEPGALCGDGDPATTLHACAACGNTELYKMKGFPHWLGLTILTTACIAFLVLNAYRLQWWAWAVLLASAVVDGVLYLAVRDVVVCYRCGAQHRGLASSGNRPFELTVSERYRQETIRLRSQESNGNPFS
jgi:ribosomal protein L37AE/L43A